MAEQYSELRRGRHVVFELHAHLVFVTKRRQHVLDANARRLLKGYLSKVCDSWHFALKPGQCPHTVLLQSTWRW